MRGFVLIRRWCSLDGLYTAEEYLLIIVVSVVILFVDYLDACNDGPKTNLIASLPFVGYSNVWIAVEFRAFEGVFFLIVILRNCVTSGSDPCGTRNTDSDGRPKRSRTSEDESERRGLEAGVRLDVDKHAGGP